MTTGLDAASRLGEEVLVMGCNVELWLVGVILGTGLIVPGERGDSVTVEVAGGGGITVGREEWEGRERNSGLSMLLVFFLVFINEGNDMDEFY